MDTILGQIKDDIIQEFQIGTAESLTVEKSITSGYSSAEVYIVELKHPSKYEGYYFLKIDSDRREFDNHGRGFRFRNVAKCVEKRKIGDHYVLLLQIAGKSLKDFKSIDEISSLKTERNAANRMVSEMLRQSVRKTDLIGEAMSPPELFRKYLGPKLDPNGMLGKYLTKVTGKNNLQEIRVIVIDEKYLPNAYAYAVNPKIWGNCLLRDTRAAVHGDLHCRNLFVSTKSDAGDYALIDMASYKEDGYLFFDMAYLELSLMLRSLEHDSLDKWLGDVQKVLCGDWEDLGCRYKEIICVIAEQGEAWIQEICQDDAFSYMDILHTSRVVSRIIAGLNYAGKRDVADETRRRAFLYACCFLKELIAAEKISPALAGEAVPWSEVPEDDSEGREDGNRCLNFIGRFDKSARYIMVLGDEARYPDQVLDHLSRVPWYGVISFQTCSEGIEDKFAVRRINPSNYKTRIDNDMRGTWWLYADGITADPDSCKTSYAEWRNKYRGFYADFCKKLNDICAPNDLLLIIDVSSFSEEKRSFYLRELLTNIDVITNANVRAAVLDRTQSYHVEEQDYSNLRIEVFHFGLSGIARYCSIYLPGKAEDNVVLPSHQGYPGAIIEREDREFIEKYVTLVHRHLSAREDSESYMKKNSFYCGEPISWSAVDEELYVSRKQIDGYAERVRNTLKEGHNDGKDSSQAIKVITIAHKPGAGATILGKAVCWRLKDEFPTVILKDRLDENVYESLQRISSLSGKNLLVLMDGDFDQNDVNQLKICLGGHRIRACILYTHRIYNEQDDKADLSTLTYEEGIGFQAAFEQKMEALQSYSENECLKRRRNMDALSSDQSLIDFRLPFFYGMYAFENDYRGVREYLNSVIENMKKNDRVRKIICYIALVSRYTEVEGINFKYVKKLTGQSQKSGREILALLQKDYPSLIFIINSGFRICHPVIATKILQEFYPKFASESYKEFCVGFIRDMRELDKGETMSEHMRNMMLKLFIRRDMEGELGENAKKKTFSQLILDIENSNLQEQVFACLVEAMPDAPYFRQHYGRLIIINDPARIVEAKKQFDMAIQLEPENAVYYHSLGDMYTRYIKYIANTTEKSEGGSALYNRTAVFVSEAMKNYHKSVELHKRAGSSIHLMYPFISIIQTCTYVVHQALSRSYKGNSVQEFLELDNEVSRWCKSLISEAQEVNMETEYRYSGIRDYRIYESTSQALLKYRYSESELEKLMEKSPEDKSLKTAYLSVIEPGKDKWKSRDNRELERIIEVCESLFALPGGISEGELWKWFNAYVHMQDPSRTVTRMLGILETLEGLEANLTANYFLYVLYFCRYMNLKDETCINKMKDCIDLCRKLSNDGSNKSYMHFYYTGKGEISLSPDEEDLPYLDGKVLRIDGNQSGYLSLDVNPHIQVFFVPIRTDIRRGQELNQPVKIRLGFSYDGLRASEVKRVANRSGETLLE